LGANLRLGRTTSGSVDFIEQQAVHALANPNSANEKLLAQLGLKHKLDTNTGLHLGLDAGLDPDTHSLRATIGINRRF